VLLLLLLKVSFIKTALHQIPIGDNMQLFGNTYTDIDYTHKHLRTHVHWFFQHYCGVGVGG